MLTRLIRRLHGRCLACGGKLWVYDVHTRVCDDCQRKYATGF